MRVGMRGGGHLQRDGGDEGATIREAWPPPRIPTRLRGAAGNQRVVGRAQVRAGLRERRAPEKAKRRPTESDASRTCPEGQV